MIPDTMFQMANKLLFTVDFFFKLNLSFGEKILKQVHLAKSAWDLQMIMQSPLHL